MKLFAEDKIIMAKNRRGSGFVASSVWDSSGMESDQYVTMEGISLAWSIMR